MHSGNDVTPSSERQLQLLDVLPFDLAAANVHAGIRFELLRVGLQIGTSDALIAATALANDLGVLTENVREFQRVPGLTVVEPR